MENKNENEKKKENERNWFFLRNILFFLADQNCHRDLHTMGWSAALAAHYNIELLTKMYTNGS